MINMLKNNISKQEMYIKIKEFLTLHSKDYTEEEQSFILKNTEWGMKCNFVPDILRQIYDHLELIETKDNIYQGFTELIKENFGLNKNIVEVGGGRIHCLGNHIALQQESGTITIYDPKLLTTNSELQNLILKKEKFTKASYLKDAQLIIGFMPCSATELLIKTACENNIDFIVALCDGNSEKSDLYFDYEEEWQAGIIYDAKKQIEKYGLGTLEFASLEQYDDPYPVIYNKRKKDGNI